MDVDTANSTKKEERLPSKRVRWEKRTVNKPDEFVDDADLEG